MILTPSTQSIQETCEKLRLDAIIATDDLSALAVLGELTGSGIRIPMDVAVAGQGDQPFASLSSPALTTVDYKPDLLSTVVMDLLNERLQDGGNPVRNVRITPELVIRESTG